MAATGQEMVKGKISSGQEKVREIHFKSGKFLVFSGLTCESVSSIG